MNASSRHTWEASPVLDVQEIDTYYGDSQVLRDVSISVDRGEVVGLLGRNGAGKTTILRSITGIQPPRAGHIEFEGAAITDKHKADISRRGIKLVPEDRRPFRGLTVKENLRISVDSTHGSDWNIERVLSEFPNLRERADEQAGHLSGGEQQMLAIGQALVGNPKLILLDEPLEGLAPMVVDQILDILDMISETNIAVVLVEQNFRLIVELIDRGYLVHKGEIVMSGDADHFIGGTDKVEKYLGVSV